MSVIATGMDMPECCLECYFMSICPRNRKKEVCLLRPAEGLIEELEEYARRQGDGWDYGIVQGAIDIVKEYCGMEGVDDTNNNRQA